MQSQKPISYVSHLDISGAGAQPSVKTARVSAPKVAFYKSWTASMDEGWTRWLFEQFEIPFINIHDAEVKAGDLAERFNVIVIPSMSADAISKYPDGDLLMSGYLMGEKYLHNRVAVVEVPLGEGKVILLGFVVQNRAQPHTTFKLLFNSLYPASMK